MKVLNKLMISAVTLVLLTGCSSQKISASKFQDKVDNLEVHFYSKAIVSYNIERKGHGRYWEDETEQKSGRIVFKYVEDDWEPVDEDVDLTIFYSDRFIIDSILYSIEGTAGMEEDLHELDDEDFQTNVTYYTNPLKMVVHEKGIKWGGVIGYTPNSYQTFDVDNSHTITFDKYGFVTKYSLKIDEKITHVNNDGTVTGTVKGTETYSITYKD